MKTRDKPITTFSNLTKPVKGLQRGHCPTDVSYTRRFRRNHQLCAFSNLVDPGRPCSASQSAAAVCNVAADISRPTHTQTHTRTSFTKGRARRRRRFPGIRRKPFFLVQLFCLSRRRRWRRLRVTSCFPGHGSRCLKSI